MSRDRVPEHAESCSAPFHAYTITSTVVWPDKFVYTFRCVLCDHTLETHEMKWWALHPEIEAAALARSPVPGQLLAGYREEAMRAITDDMLKGLVTP